MEQSVTCSYVNTPLLLMSYSETLWRALSVWTTEEKENLWSARQITCVFTENTDKTTIILYELCTVYVLFVHCP